MTLKKDADAELARLRTALASAEAKARALSASVWPSVWLRWEPYLCVALGVLVGIAIGHFL